MKGVETFLDFTVESGEDFEGGWLPTLDVNLKVGSDNVIMYKFFAKEICSSITVQKRAVMEENKKIKILANDLMRRLNNSMEQ